MATPNNEKTAPARSRKETEPVQTSAYRLAVDTPSFEAGHRIRVARALDHIGGEGQVEKVYVWTEMPKNGRFFLLGADVIYRASVFDRQVKRGDIESEEDWQARRDAHDLHRELGSRVPDHARYASEVLGRDVKHLSALSQVERDRIRQADLPA
jgi:hypothetical protein